MRVHFLKVTKFVQAFGGAAQFFAAELLPVGQTQFAQNHVVAGFGVAFQLYPAHVHLVFGGKLIIDVDHAFLGVGVGIHRHVGESIAVIGVQIGQPPDVFLHGFQREVLILFLLLVEPDQIEQTLFGIDEIAPEADFAQLVAGSFAHAVDDAYPIVFILHFRRGNLSVDIPLVDQIGLDGLGVTVQQVFLKHSRPGEP